MSNYVDSFCLKLCTICGILDAVIEMLYVCDSCGAQFSLDDSRDLCPDCGESMLRLANVNERRTFVEEVAKSAVRDYAERRRFPNCVVTQLSMLQCFTFQLPVTALQIDSDIIIDIIVEFGESKTVQGGLAANIWAKRAGGMNIAFLMPLVLPSKQGETSKKQMERIFAALSGHDLFYTSLFHFASGQLRHEG